MTPGSPELTKSQVNRAGKALRKREDWDAYRNAMGILLRFRAAHSYPLQKATMGLRSMVKTENCDVEVSQRLKRVPTILDKLRREPTLPLASMQDIGGCRAVLNSIDEVRRVQRRLSKNRPPMRVYDYIADPRASGYRAVHVIVGYDDRRIEVQLRTRVMHEWAVTVERLSGRLQEDLKGSKGPQPLVELLEAISRAMAIEERSEVVSPELVAAIGALRDRAVPFLTTGGAQ